ncbi:unnamed protein product [Linum tenue]|uniref:Uncharacterized protein n=1 Tax=Linum tenue TaxID=586396 RepID=A0AAV0KEG5_9ROSI|nr:unnamed protein product [Linum tenue]
MSKITAGAAGSLLSPLIQKEQQQQQLIGNFTTGEGEWKKLGRKQWRLHSRSSRQHVQSQISVQQPQTYSATITTDIPLHESPSPAASFDRYLEDKPRVFQAMFPDKQRSQQLNEEEWRIQMLPINFVFLTVWPTVDARLRCIAGGRDYPPQITKVMELQIVRYNNQLMHMHF